MSESNNDDIIKRIEYLETEMKLLKKQQRDLLGKSSESPKMLEKIEPVKPAVQSPPVYSLNQRQATAEEQSLKPAPSKKEFDLEKALAQWMPRVFMFILLLGVLWGLKVGMDKGYITNPVRIAMGYGGTILLYYFGMKYVKQQNKVFGLTLLGGLIALGILTTFAAHHLYGYFNFITAFIIGVAYVIVGIWLSEKTKSETLTIFSAIGGFLLPFLLEGEGATSLQFCVYILILFLSLFYVSLKQEHKYTFYVTFLLFHMTLLTFGILDGSQEDRQIIVGTVLIQHLSLLYFYLKGKISRHVFSEALVYSNFIFALGWIKILDANEETLLYGGFALLYVAITWYLFKKNDALLQGVFSAVSIFAISAFILSYDFENIHAQVLLLLVNGTVGLWVGLRFKTIRTILTSSFIYLFTSLAVLTTEIPNFIALENVVWVVFLGTLIFIYYTIYQHPPHFIKGKRKYIDQSLIVGQVISLIYIIQLTNLAVEHTYLSNLTKIHIHFLVLTLVLVGMYAFHKWDKGKYLTHAVLIQFLFMGLVMLPTGLSSYFDRGNYIFNLIVEVFYVILLTIMFQAIIKEKFYLNLNKFQSKFAIVMQVLYFIFLNKWYLSFTNVYQWDLEYVYLVHTFLLFAFSFISISLGKKKSWKSIKVIGAALIVFCVLKLFMWDLGSVSIFIRAILFTIVGIVGLLYSRTILKEK